MRYVPVEALDGRPHVMVDGAPRPGTACTLSHWPGTPTPRGLWDDVSAGIVMRARATPCALPAGVALATVDHYDADGVIALALLCDDALARSHGPLLVEAAAVGDFDVVRSRPAALVAFALATVGDARRARAAGLAPPDRGAGPGGAWAAAEALRLLPELAEDPGRRPGLWAEEARAYDAAVQALEDGRVRIEDRPEHDVAVVHVPAHDGAPDEAAAMAWQGAPVHRAAVHSRTACLRVLTVAGRRVDLRYRYESWVRLVSRRPRPRVDLCPLAAALTAMEGGAARWVFEGAGAITPALRTEGDAPSALDPGAVVERVLQELARLDAGPPAWDPYAGVGGGA
ncbi:MAG TPA: DUF6687 family protein [Acidimicrobiales bacterium]|nr:DUF6687 family protein [Acidimicrobiales bacterium]